MSFISDLVGDRLTSLPTSTPTSSDPRDRLPPEVREKLIRLEDEAFALHGAIPEQRYLDAFERVSEIRQQKARFQETLHSGRRPDDIERLADFDARIERAKAEADRIRKLRDDATEAWNKSGAIVQRCREFLNPEPATGAARARNKEIRAARTPEVKLAAGQSLAMAVAKVRESIDAVSRDRQRIELAPAPAAELAKNAIAGLDGLAAQGAPSFDPRIRGRDPFKLGHHLTHPGVGVAFLLFLFRDEIAERLTAIIGDDVHGTLTDADRDKLLAKNDAKRLELERQEEALIVTAAEALQTIERRPDADIRAILGVE
ncbi:hypothetical protein FY133_01050 [Agrobacterium tumefaciens]|uniref:hypothetical protein n=1 Tax=Agrobacterium tumefaciens TaxID=358 RepID=UPI0021D04CF8|nr:hypothetical protein [Agrobacterium tumefaciens]UXS08199.1 hypothetical protein FY155_00745 [Agrobacterium tumefaciens]UXS15562.1 hypothetical protein FY154_00745 [Agrobacterium tumefaciens]UXT64231.1 hypothetical protein FY133_01050 [Agrobacterium tumefaciens]